MDISRFLDLNKPLIADPVRNLDDKYLCKECKMLLYNAIQTECGERFCRQCVETVSSEILKCPIDKAECKFFVDRFANKEILALEFYCPYYESCHWNGALCLLIKEHFGFCDYAIQLCDNCGEEVVRKDLVRHREAACKNSFYFCEFCNEEVVVKDKNKHLCLKAKEICALGCGEQVVRENLITHIKECKNWEKVCVYRLIGCKHVSSPLDDHYKSNVKVHNSLMMFFVQKMNLTQMTLKNDLKNLKNENSALREQLNTALQTIQKFNTESNENMKKQSNDNASRFAALELHVNDLKELSSKKIPFDDYNQKLSTVESSHEKLSSSLNDLQLSQQILENTSYDGHLLWKISSYRQRSKDALSGVVPALHSAPCYTLRFGYKYCLRLYLNGDGAGKGSYISLFFVLMKSDYDALHKWPFQNRVTFRLRAKNPDNDIVESFTPDKNSSSFSKPIREMNIAAGVPLFAKKTDINERFILDDAIYIESKIHL